MRSIISVSRFVCTLKNYINNSKIDLVESLLNQRMAAATQKNEQAGILNENVRTLLRIKLWSLCLMIAALFTDIK